MSHICALPAGVLSHASKIHLPGLSITRCLLPSYQISLDAKLFYLWTFCHVHVYVTSHSTERLDTDKIEQVELAGLAMIMSQAVYLIRQHSVAFQLILRDNRTTEQGKQMKEER